MSELGSQFRGTGAAGAPSMREVRDLRGDHLPPVDDHEEVLAGAPEDQPALEHDDLTRTHEEDER